MTARLPLLYIAGPYRAETREGVDLNIQAARAVGLLAARKGWCPVIPHSMTANLDAIAPSIGDEFWLTATLEVMRRCDAVLLLPGWSQSSGTRAEYEEAVRLAIEVYLDVDNMPGGQDFIDTIGLRTPGRLP